MKLVKIVKKSDALSVPEEEREWFDFVEKKKEEASRSSRWGSSNFHPVVDEVFRGMKLGLYVAGKTYDRKEIANVAFDDMIKFLDDTYNEARRRFPDKDIRGWR